MPAVTHGSFKHGSFKHGSIARGTMSERCAYCGALLPVNIEGVEAWRIGSRFVCNEFCTDGMPEEQPAQRPVLRPTSRLPKM